MAMAVMCAAAAGAGQELVVRRLVCEYPPLPRRRVPVTGCGCAAPRGYSGSIAKGAVKVGRRAWTWTLSNYTRTRMMESRGARVVAPVGRSEQTPKVGGRRMQACGAQRCASQDPRSRGLGEWVDESGRYWRVEGKREEHLTTAWCGHEYHPASDEVRGFRRRGSRKLRER